MKKTSDDSKYRNFLHIALRISLPWHSFSMITVHRLYVIVTDAEIESKSSHILHFYCEFTRVLYEKQTEVMKVFLAESTQTKNLRD